MYKRQVLKYADKTGFSVPSVLAIMNAKKNAPEIADADTWNPDYLFSSSNDYLAKKIEVIGQLREVKLGTDSYQSKFNPEMVAKVIILDG